MFDDRVYKRGALTLHALRVTVGDDAFFSLLKDWVAEHTGGSVTTEDFRAFASGSYRRRPGPTCSTRGSTQTELPDLPASS